MPRRDISLTILGFTLCFLGSAAAQQKGQPAYLRILMPDENAILLIDYRPTKQTGSKRVFVSPPLALGKTFTYTVMARWEADKETETVRMRTVTVQAGKVIEIDLSKADKTNPDRTLAAVDSPPDEVITQMCKLAGIGKDDIVYDLGCGDGGIVISAVAEFNARRGVGIDEDADLLKDAVDAAKEENVSDKIRFLKQDLLTVADVGDATVVMLSSGEDLNVLMAPMLKRTLKKGARIVSYNGAMGDWQADKSVSVTDSQKGKHALYLWTIK